MEITVVDSLDNNRFEGYADGTLVGFLNYSRRDPTVVALTHAETLHPHGGQGVASAITKFALDAIRAEGVLVRPSCPFVAGYIADNPAYADLVAR
ncbi:putative GNAT family acetyltransferase [Allocatelliglobosispora scoriae]|uniref:Putative GNAT family acetyltransferase n=1 Tax=Allocatelliglobosispora scoriae TaxID=643052 RepID=A0A841BQI5_9ACTN|nr:GNAT family N-acetyltransferase [Allocatelliglobosispora scoriae]MBB5869586.1 putative GNAT family acetyltransferase [Allocatelliglobosispora scoriae]